MKTVVIFGGSGFIGRNIIRRLAKRRFRIIVPYQIPIDESRLRLYGKLGQIIPIKLSMINSNSSTVLYVKKTHTNRTFLFLTVISNRSPV